MFIMVKQVKWALHNKYVKTANIEIIRFILIVNTEICVKIKFSLIEIQNIYPT